MPSAYRELYEEGRRILEEVPLPDAALDARLLLEEVCGTNLQTLLVYPETAVNDADCTRYRALIERRRLREPTAMILGEWDFMGLTFKVTKDTLIPEQDTEVLVETALEYYSSSSGHEWFRPIGSAGPEEAAAERESVSAFPADGNERTRNLRILDLCTGSGCILLSLLHFLPDAVGIGTDISAGALAVAAENARRHGLAGRTILSRGDLWEAVPEGGRFDLIVSNPPYVPTERIAALEPEVRCGEPLAALDGGTDGLAFYRRILARADGFLKENGLLILESGFDEAADIRSLMEENGFEVLRTVKDYGGLDRVVVGKINVREDGFGAAAL